VAPLVPVIGGGMRRRTLLVVLAGLAVVVAAGVVMLWPRAPSRITRENHSVIQHGMSRREVESILGPPGDYTTGPTSTNFVYPRLTPDHTPWVEWKADRASVKVCFSDSGTVRYTAYASLCRQDQGVLANSLWRVKRQWHRWFPE
jgi:hypothetical protein